ncbi:sugar-binding protein [Kribbella sp. NPDC049584]|uniref:sugar-binding protein n=1 Tax=Kribbella sp. NPDC049584 TaxID=3154833 RepID=UPI0034246447
MLGSLRKLVAVLAVGLLAAGQLAVPAQAAGDPGIVFSSPVAADGVAAWPGDADKTPEHAASTRLGVPCWQTSNDPKDQYIYLNIDAARIPAGATDAVLTVNYFDTPGQQLTAQYDSVSAAFTPLPWFTSPGSGAWASTQFRMSNVNFQNRANGADIRLMANAPGGVISSVCISSVSISFADTTGITVTNQSLVFQQGTGSVTLTSTASSIAWSITDDQYLPVASGNTINGSVNVANLGPGFYNLRLTAGNTVVGTTLAVIPPLPAGIQSPQGKWGVNTHMNHYYNLSSALIRTLALAGFSHIRESLEWPRIESGSPGNYAVDPLEDAVIADAKANGLTPLLGTGYRNPLYDGGHTPSTPEGLAAYGRYQSWWLKHFAGTTNDIGTYNEYYQTGFNDSACGITGACFVQLMKVAYEQTHADNPNANVLADIGPNKGDTSFRDQILSLGGLAYVDSIDAHIYTFAGPEGDLDTQIQSLRTQADAHGGAGKPIWISEEGYPTAPSFGGSMLDQARKSIRNDAIMIANNVSQFYWYDALNDGTNLDDKESTFGLLQAPAGPIAGMAPKPGLVAKATTIRALTGLAYSGRDTLAAPLYSYRFGSGTSTTRVLWSTGTGTSSVQLNTTVPLEVTDMYGHKTTLTPTAGVVTMTVDQDPVFVKGAATGVAVTATPQATVAAADPSNSQEPTAVTVTIKGSVHNAGPAAVTVAGQTKQTLVVPGRNTTVTIPVPASDTLGLRHVVATVSRLGKTTARLVAWTSVEPATKIRVVPQLTAAAPTGLGVELTNTRASSSATIQDLSWTIAGQHGTAGAGQSIAPGQKATISIPVPGLAPWKAYAYTVDLTTSDGNKVSAKGTTAFDPIVPSATTPASSMNLATDASWIAFTRPWGGAADLSGSASFQYDATGLTINAAVTDDVFSQTETAPNLWRGDSLQFAISNGLPGENATATELGAALLPTGPAVYTFGTSDGSPTGTTPGATAAITRADGVTSYQVKVPWTALGFATQPAGPVAISLALNENDGAGRAGALQWGSGIVTGKTTTLFLPGTFTS